MLGVVPDRSVTGAVAGKVEYSSTAITCSPAPTAKSISVAVGEREMMATGLSSICTSPLAAATVTGKSESFAGSVEGGDVDTVTVVEVDAGNVPSSGPSSVSVGEHALSTNASAAAVVLNMKHPPAGG